MKKANNNNDTVEKQICTDDENSKQKQELIEFIQSIDCPPLLDYLTGIKKRLVEKWGF